jgi:ketosteroid isomerase-like protein
MSEENKAVVRKYYESLDKGDFDTTKGLLADDFGSDFMGQEWTIESYM